jgi:hypothetical protein
MATRTIVFYNLVVCLSLAAGACAEKEEQKIEQPSSTQAVAPEASQPKAAPDSNQVEKSICSELDSLPEDVRKNIPKDADIQKVVEDSGKLKLPEPGALSDGETHTRHAWKMPKGASSALAVIRWEDTSWGDVEFALGMGICPHRGLKLADTVSSTGLAVVHYVHSPDRAWPEPDWFLHVNADKALEIKAGEELSYKYQICAD